MRYYTKHTLSPNMQETPEGYLLCPGVPIARTGVQEYVPEDFVDEVPVKPGPSGVILVIRTEEEVFSPTTIASFEGKSITLEHPDPDPDPDVPDVNPDNWRELTCGVGMDVRRGAGDQSDLLLADLLITDAEAIDAVKTRKFRQVSCGYDADYQEIRPGVGRQVNIIGNHIALVPHGRAGGRVGIKDAAPKTKETHMAKATGKKTGFWDRFTKHLKKGKTADEAAQAAAQDEEQPEQPVRDDEQQPATDSGDAIAALTAKMEEMSLMLRTLMEEKAAGTSDDEPGKTDDDDPAGTADGDPERTEDEEPEESPGSTKTGDARRVRVADAATVRRARAIAPGLSVQVGDSAAAAQKLALRRACQDASLKGAVDGFLSGRTIDSLSSSELSAVFCTTAELARHVNNRKTADGLASARRGVGDFGKPATPADVNALNNKFYDKKAG